MKLNLLLCLAGTCVLVGCGTSPKAINVPAPSTTGVAGSISSGARAVERADTRAQEIERTGAAPGAQITKDLRKELQEAKADLAEATTEISALQSELKVFADGYNNVRKENQKLASALDQTRSNRGWWQGLAYAFMGLSALTLIGGLFLGELWKPFGMF